MTKAERFTLFIIGLFTFSLLFYASSTVLLNGSDEEELFVEAGQISLMPREARLPLASPNILPHSLLTSYLIKAGFALFGGEGIMAGRFLFVLLGAIGLLLVYFLTRKGLGKRVALLSILILCVEKYYICNMRYAQEDALCIFFSLAALYLFFKALTTENKFMMMFTGVAIGMGLYGKGTLALLLPIFFIYLLLDKRYRSWLGLKEFYIMGFISLFIFSPFIIYNLRHSLFTFRYITSVARFGLSPISLTVFMGEPLSFLVDEKVIVDIFDCEYPFMNWVAGILVLSGVGYSVKHDWDNSLVKLLAVTFLFNFVMFSLIANNAADEPNSLLNNTEWPSLMVVPGIVLCANMLARLWNKRIWCKIPIIALILYLGYDLIKVINLPESFYIPRRDIMLKQLKDLAQYDLDRGYYGYAKRRFEKLIKWSDDGEELRQAHLKLLYLSDRAKEGVIKEYYPPSKDVMPDEIMRQADFLGSVGEDDLAISKYRELIRNAPCSKYAVRAYNNLGLIYARQGLIELAREQWNKAFQMEPQNPKVRENLDRHSAKPKI